MTKNNFKIRVILLLLGCVTSAVLIIVLISHRQYDYIGVKVNALHRNADKIINYCQQLKSEKYAGMLRGPLGTLWSEGGNDLDKSLLLKEMLKRIGIKSQLIQERNSFSLNFLLNGKWNHYSPYNDHIKYRDSSKAKAGLENNEKHLVEISLRAYTGVGKFKNYPILTCETASLIGKVCNLSYKRSFFSKKPRPVFNDGKKNYIVNCDLRTILALEMHFNIKSPGENCLYRRMLFDLTRAVGHTRANFDDFYTLVFLPNLINFDILQQEIKNVDSQRSSTLRQRLINKSYLITLAFTAFSDATMRQLADQMQVETYYNSPRILIGSIETDQGQGIQIGLDLLKNNIFARGESAKHFNFAKSMADNVLEGRVLSTVLNTETLTTKNLFELYFNPDANYGANTVCKRLVLYQDALVKLIHNDKIKALAISCGTKGVEISKRRQLYLIAGKDDQLSIANALKDEGATFEPAENGSVACPLNADPLQAALALDKIFTTAFKRNINYQPSIRLIKNEKITTFTFLNDHYRLKYEKLFGKYQTSAYWRNAGDNGEYLWEWFSPMSSRYYHYSGTFDSNLSSAYSSNLIPSQMWAFHTGDDTQVWDKSYWKNEKEDFKFQSKVAYPVLFNGEYVELEANHWSNSQDQLWILNSAENPLILKHQSASHPEREEGYDFELKAIDSRLHQRIVHGRVIDETTGQGIENANLVPKNSVGLYTTDGNGDFDICINYRKNLAKKSVVLIIDNSGSMQDPARNNASGKKKIEMAVDAAAKFIDDLPKDTEIIIRGLAGEDTDYQNEFTFDREKVKKCIEPLATMRLDTKLATTLEQVIDSLKSKAMGENQTAILLSDGENRENTTMLEVYTRASYKISVYTIGFDVTKGSKAEKDMMDLSQYSGGKYFTADSFDQLQKAFITLAGMPEHNSTEELTIYHPRYTRKTLMIGNNDQGHEMLIKLSPGPKEEASNKVLAVISRDNLTELETIPIRQQTKELIKEIISDPQITVIIPTEPIDLNDRITTAWYELNKRTGEIKGRLENGLYGSLKIIENPMPDYDPNKTPEGNFIDLTKKYLPEYEVVKSYWGQNQAKSAPLKKYFAMLAGMYTFSSGILDGIEGVELTGTLKSSGDLNDWLNTVNDHAKKFTEVFFNSLPSNCYIKEEANAFFLGASVPNAVFVQNGVVILNALVEYEFNEIRDYIKSKL